MLDDAAEVSGRDLDDCRGAIAVRALDSGAEVLPGCMVTDARACPPTLRAVHLAPPRRRVSDRPAQRPRVSLTGHTRWDRWGQGLSQPVPDPLRTGLTCGFLEPLDKTFGTAEMDLSPRNRGQVDQAFCGVQDGLIWALRTGAARRIWAVTSIPLASSRQSSSQLPSVPSPRQRSSSSKT